MRRDAYPSRVTVRPTAGRILGLAILVVALVGGCSPTDRSPSPAATSGPSSSAAATAAPSGVAGTHVRVLGVWSGPELDSFKTVASTWEQETGAVVDWEATTDLAAAVAAHRQAGDLPDIAILPNLALMDQLAQDGTLIPLDGALDRTALARDYSPAWLRLGSHGGKLYGIFYKLTSKATVWYNPKAFAAAGYHVPATWNEMITLAEGIVSDGRTPFSVVSPRGPASGWALTDWVSEIVLNHCGPDLYDRWIAAEIPWTDPCIRQSFALFATVLSTRGYVLGGAERILATGDDAAADPLYADPPTAYLCYLASFAQAFIATNHPDLRPGPDYAVFPFPAIDADHAGAVTVGADIPVMTRDTPVGRSFLSYLAGARSQEAWIKLGGFTSVNRSIPAEAYPDPVARSVAEQLTKAEVSRFSAGDMMPPSLQQAWWAAMVDLVGDPTQLDPILERLTAAARGAR
jgi:alpha-glucoside transport system substrate-binding protein